MWARSLGIVFQYHLDEPYATEGWPDSDKELLSLSKQAVKFAPDAVESNAFRGHVLAGMLPARFASPHPRSPKQYALAADYLRKASALVVGADSLFGDNGDEHACSPAQLARCGFSIKALAAEADACMVLARR